jgi:hypothetical protein
MCYFSNANGGGGGSCNVDCAMHVDKINISSLSWAQK